MQLHRLVLVEDDLRNVIARASGIIKIIGDFPTYKVRLKDLSEVINATFSMNGKFS